jgi:hypothetical protein
MNHLNAALRMLAEAGPREAPDHVETALKQSFCRYRRARRLRRGIVVAIVAGAAAAAIAIVTSIPQPTGPPARISAHLAPPATAWSKPECGAGTHACRVETHLDAPTRKPTRRPPTDRLATSEFIPLPYGDDALIGESSRIVRVEMPRSALRMAGFNVAQERANERVQADVLLGADGLAHAVRFVRYTE